MKPDKSAGSFDGFLSHFSAASLKRGEDKGVQKDAEMTSLQQGLLYSVCPKISQKAFSLTELLVAIAIVAVVALLSTLGVATVRGKAHTTQCMQNMRQLAMGMILYNQDNRGFYPPHLGQYPTLEGRYTLVWYGHIARYVSDWNHSVNTPMAKTFYCPANKVADPNYPATYISTADPQICRNYSYGYNYGKLSSQVGYAAIRSTAILNKSKLVILSEIPNFQTPSDAYPFPLGGAASQTNLKQYPGGREISVRHGGRATFAFADGHLETHPVKDLMGNRFDINQWLPEIAQ